MTPSSPKLTDQLAPPNQITAQGSSYDSSTRLFLVTGLVSLVTVAVLPFILPSTGLLTVMAQMGVWIVFALAYNICLGGTGLLSFCHGLYFGLGAFAASHAINHVAAGKMIFIPVWLMPLVGFVAGGCFGLLLAAFLCRRIGVAFVMITLGLSQLFVYVATALDSVFHGESGVTINRAYGGGFGPQIQVYWLVAGWLIVTTLAIWTLGKTAFGKLARAVRENEERVRFLGQDVVRVRFFSITLSAAFAGLAGALHAINIEQVSTHLLGLKTSAFVLFMVVIGGARNFFGPVIGAIIIALLDKILPNYTGAWLLYLGLAFCLVILRSPGGLMGMIDDRLRLVSTKRLLLSTLLIQDSQRFLSTILLGAGAVMVIEMSSALSSGAQFYEAKELTLIGIPVAPHSLISWGVAALLLAVGAVIARRTPPLGKV